MSWNVLAHGPLRQLADNLWVVTGAVPNMSLERTMVVARLADHRLVIHSAIAMNDEEMTKLEALGTPRYLVVPNGWHRLDARKYLERYPEMEVICPSDARAMVEEAVPVHASYAERAQISSDDDTVGFEEFGGKKNMEGVMMVRSSDGVTAVFGDSLFNLPHQPGFFWFVYGRIMGATGGPKTTVLGRMFLRFGGSLRAYKDFLARLSERADLVRLIPGHGDIVDEDARGVAAAVSRSL